MKKCVAKPEAYVLWQGKQTRVAKVTLDFQNWTNWTDATEIRLKLP